MMFDGTDLGLLLLVLVCALTDVYAGKVYDRVTWPAALAGLAMNAMSWRLEGALWSLAGFALGFGVLYLIYLTGKMGGGDVKFMAAIGALKGPAFVYVTLVYSFLVGGFLSVLYLLWGRSRGAEPAQAPEARVPRARAAIPFGAAIALAALWTYAEQLLGVAFVDWLH